MIQRLSDRTNESIQRLSDRTDESIQRLSNRTDDSIQRLSDRMDRTDDSIQRLSDRLQQLTSALQRVIPELSPIVPLLTGAKSDEFDDDTWWHARDTNANFLVSTAHSALYDHPCFSTRLYLHDRVLRRMLVKRSDAFFFRPAMFDSLLQQRDCIVFEVPEAHAGAVALSDSPLGPLSEVLSQRFVGVTHRNRTIDGYVYDVGNDGVAGDIRCWPGCSGTLMCPVGDTAVDTSRCWMLEGLRGESAPDSSHTGIALVRALDSRQYALASVPTASQLRSARPWEALVLDFSHMPTNADEQRSDWTYGDEWVRVPLAALQADGDGRSYLQLPRAKIQTMSGGASALSRKQVPPVSSKQH